MLQDQLAHDYEQAAHGQVSQSVCFACVPAQEGSDSYQDALSLLLLHACVFQEWNWNWSWNSSYRNSEEKRALN